MDLFVAGTDTEVGKTVVSAALLAWLRSRSLDATYLKPVSTDGKMLGNRLVSPDAIWVKKVCSLDQAADELNPVCFTHPLSPLASARLGKKEISWDEILRRIQNKLRPDMMTVCEGVGGIMVPLCHGRTVLDLMVELGFPVILVARPDLGTINHTLLSLQAMAQRGLDILGFVFSRPQSGPALQVPSAKNSQLVEEFSGVTFLGELPSMESVDSTSLASAVSEHLDLQSLARI